MPLLIFSGQGFNLPSQILYNVISSTESNFPITSGYAFLFYVFPHINSFCDVPNIFTISK